MDYCLKCKYDPYNKNVIIIYINIWDERDIYYSYIYERDESVKKIKNVCVFECVRVKI